VRTVSNPVHGAQRRVVEGILTQGDLSGQCGSAKHARLREEAGRNVGGVGANTSTKRHASKDRSGKGSCAPSKARQGSRQVGRGITSTPSMARSGPPLTEQAADRAIATTDIEPRCALRQESAGASASARTRARRPKTRARWLRANPGERPGLWRGSHQIGSACKFSPHSVSENPFRQKTKSVGKLRCGTSRIEL